MTKSTKRGNPGDKKAPPGLKMFSDNPVVQASRPEK